MKHSRRMGRKYVISYVNYACYEAITMEVISSYDGVKGESRDKLKVNYAFFSFKRCSDRSIAGHEKNNEV